MNKIFVSLIGAGSVALMVGCGGSVSALTKDHVSKSDVAVQQATQTLGNTEAGAIELQRAKDNLGQAKAAVEAKNGKAADRFASMAQLDAELAVAKSQTASTRKAADEVLASIETLRNEAARGTP
jgi:hypothetical protein